MKPNIGGFDRFARAVLGLLFIMLAFGTFTNPLAKIAFVVIGGFVLIEAAAGWCPLYGRHGVTAKRLAETNLYLLALLAMQVVLAYVWLHSGWGKITGDFAAQLPGTLARFAGGTPYGWFASLIRNVAIPNAGLVAGLVMWSEMLAGVTMIAGAALLAYGKDKWHRTAYVLSIIGLLCGLGLNKMFWLAGGWTSPGTATANVAMFWPQLILAYVWIVRLMDEKKS